MRDLRSSLSLITAGDTVLALDDVKAHLRIDAYDDDDYVSSLIDAAQSYVDGRDGQLGRALLAQQWKLTLESFYDCRLFEMCYHLEYRRDRLRSGEIKLPLPPLRSVQSVQYLDATEALQTVDASTYRIIDGGGFASSIIPKRGCSWPSAACVPDAVQVSFTAGYASVEALNAERKCISHAMLLLIAHWYGTREAVTDGRLYQPFEVPFAIDRLLAPHRTSWI